ncbi:MAG: 23S rRNA (guanosine(2251)-2'-O)-methyltransferase RlmB [Rhodospirillales bacterium]|nr:23S rRNA (guanosine(2251)-2'-O)-methyltransferase RlmB [Rhodospirillales bacterium]
MTRIVKGAMRRRKHPPAAPPADQRPAPRESAHPPPRRSARPGGDGFWLWGRHPVLAAVANPRRRLLRLCAAEETAAELTAAVLAAGGTRPAVEPLDRRTLAAPLAADAVHQGFAALARPLPLADLDDLPHAIRSAPDLLLVVLDQVTDPRNVGAVLRSAQAFGAAAVLVQDRHAPEESGALAKAASGALEAVPLIRVTNIARTLRELQEDSIRCLGLCGEAAAPLATPVLAGRVALVLGAEGSGLRRLVREACDALLRIPIAPATESLNLSVAAAVALYACARVPAGPAAPVRAAGDW